MNSFQLVKFGVVLFFVGVTISSAFTLSSQAIKRSLGDTQAWASSEPYINEQQYLDRIDYLLQAVSEHRLTSKLLSKNKDNETLVVESVSTELGAGVSMPGGEKLMGIISDSGSIYALLSVTDEKASDEPPALLKVTEGDELLSGYIVTKINASSIELKSSLGAYITVELY